MSVLKQIRIGGLRGLHKVLPEYYLNGILCHHTLAHPALPLTSYIAKERKSPRSSEQENPAKQICYVKEEFTPTFPVLCSKQTKTEVQNRVTQGKAKPPAS